MQEAVAQGQERERLLLDQHQQATPLPRLIFLILTSLDLLYLTLPCLALPCLALSYLT